MSESNLPISEDKYKDCSREQLIELLQGFQALFQTPQGIKKLNNPTTPVEKKHTISEQQQLIEKRKLTMPYYRERFGKEVKKAVDAIITDGKNRVYKYSDFKNISKNSLYLRISQSFLYLVDNLDEPPDFKYDKYRELITLRKYPDGVHLELIPPLDKEPEVSSEIVPQPAREWKSKLEDFIANGKINQKLSIKDINLDHEDIEEAKMMLFGLDDQFLYKIKKDEIIIIRFDPNSSPNV